MHPAIKMVFARLDSDGSGVVTRDELAKVLKKMPRPVPSTVGCNAATFAMHAQARSAFSRAAPSVTRGMPLGSCLPRLASTDWHNPQNPHGEMAPPPSRENAKGDALLSSAVFKDLL